MSQPTMPYDPRTPTVGRHSRPPGTPLQDSPLRLGIHDSLQQQPAAVPTVYDQAYPAVANQANPGAAVGQIRSTGLAVFLVIITLGIYGLVWYYLVHDEMKRHSGQGLGGGLGLLIAVFVGIVSPFLVSAEVGRLYQRRGLQRPVSGATGLWCLLGIFILIGPIVWFVKTNNALNAYWSSLGAR
jgi:hypothetical protein